ncbi:hypothetical protein ACWC5I_00515 [Kitasatospora sp. NPDC001574]
MRIRLALSAVALSALSAVGGWAAGNTPAEPAAPDAGQVATFNDGWSDAMANACQQGSAYACNWLSTTR